MADDTSTGSADNFGDVINAAASRYGVDPAYMMKAATIESGMDPRDVSSTGAKGLFQFTGGTASQYGLRNPFDPAQNADAAARLTSDNQARLTQSLGRQPTNGELYLAHQQGAAGAIAILTHPSESAVDALTPVYGGNRTRATQALTVNGGSPDMTAGDFASKWAARFGGGQNAKQATAQADIDAKDDAEEDAKDADNNASSGSARDYKFATGLAGALGKTFNVSAPSLMPLSQSPQASAPVIQNNRWPS